MLRNYAASHQTTHSGNVNYCMLLIKLCACNALLGVRTYEHTRLSYVMKKCSRYRNDFILGNYQNAAALLTVIKKSAEPLEKHSYMLLWTIKLLYYTKLTFIYHFLRYVINTKVRKLLFQSLLLHHLGASWKPAKMYAQSRAWLWPWLSIG